jgi:AmiR/NasT family two-component response regulator
VKRPVTAATDRRVREAFIELSSRIVIEQAKGFLAERLGVSVDIAFGLLRGYPRDHNRKLTEVAADLVEGRLQVTSGPGGG